jgi:hypothetical protein
MDGKPGGCFRGKKHHKLQLSLNNFTAGVRQDDQTNRTRAAGSQDEVDECRGNHVELISEGTSLLAKTFGVRFIDWLDLVLQPLQKKSPRK